MHLPDNLFPSSFPDVGCIKHSDRPAQIVVETRDGYRFGLCTHCRLKLTSALEAVIENTLKDSRALMRLLR